MAMGQDAIEKARWSREHQGDHEAKVSSRGEADLHRHYKACGKNPGHHQFIPVQDFNKEHLSPGYDDNDIVDLIRAVADLTCRLSVRYTSNQRPEFHPLHPSLYPFSQNRGCDWMRIGTGWVGLVDMYTETDMKICECEECIRPSTETPKKVWGQVFINTACHVIFDDEEARHTTCHFFYDTSTTHLNHCLRLSGLNIQFSDVEGDWVVMKCVTHDMGLLDRLCTMWHRWLHLCYKVWNKFQLNDPEYWRVSSDCGPCVIISHPHGCSKQLSVGKWTCRQMSGEQKEKFDDNTCNYYVNLEIEYRYNTATCPGSSGAPVIILPLGKLQLDMSLHSEGNPGNNNKSAVKKIVLVDPSISVVNEDHTLDTTEISEHGPTFHIDQTLLYPNRGSNLMRTGTGGVGLVDMYTKRDMTAKYSQCQECNRPGTHTPKTVWGQVDKNTAHHVVNNSEEARHTTCHSFYDTGTTHLNHCLGLTGLNYVKGDWAVMRCVAHELDLLNKLYKKRHHWFDIVKVWDKFQLNNPEYHSVSREVCDPRVTISHPHRCSKQLSMGMWTCKQTSNGSKEKFVGDNDFVIVAAEYRYNILAWSGSSRASVITLLPGRERCNISHHLYSEGNPGNDDKSAVRKFVSDSSRSVVNVEYMYILGLRCFAQFLEVDTTRMKDCGYYLHFTPKCTVSWSITDKDIAVTKYMIL